MSGTELAYGATRACATAYGRSGRLLRPCYGMSGTDIAYGCYQSWAMPGTDIASAAIAIRPCYAVSGTEIGYAATVCYAVSGTDIGYAATRSAELRAETPFVSALILRHAPDQPTPLLRGIRY
eukprot:2076101-Rhodomonas_salina.1